jgi:hypothetical protein
MGRMQGEKAESNWAQGQTKRPGGVAGRPHITPEILSFCPKFPYKSLNSLLPLILEIWKENFEKGNSKLEITTLLRLCKPVDVIILSQENRGHPLPQNPEDLTQGII